MDANILLAIIVVLVTINAIALLVRFSTREKPGKDVSEGNSPPKVILSGNPHTPQHSPKIELRE